MSHSTLSFVFKAFLPRSRARARFTMLAISTALVATCVPPALAQKNYSAGVSDVEIKLGQTMPLSGPISSAGGARLIAKFYQLINEAGGINGRKVTMVQADDGYSPPKTVEQTRKLVESDEVFALVGSVGTATNAAVQKYLNQKKVPQLFVMSGAARFNNPKEFPFTIPLYPDYFLEGEAYAKFLLKHYPKARIGVLYQNDDFGQDSLRGLKQGLGDQAKTMIVMEDSYNQTEPTVESHIINLRAAGVDTLVNFSSQKAAAQSIRRIYELGWKPLHLLTNVSSGLAILKAAGLDAAQGLITGRVLLDAKEVSPDRKNYLGFMKEWFPHIDPSDNTYIWHYMIGEMTVRALEKCGDNLTRENLVKQVLSNRGVQLGMLVPGISVSYRSDDYSPFQNLQIVQFSGDHWAPLGPLVTIGSAR